MIRRYGTAQFLLRSTVRLFVMVRVRYVGTLFELPTKRFMCNVGPSKKIRTTVPGVHMV